MTARNNIILVRTAKKLPHLTAGPTHTLEQNYKHEGVAECAYTTCLVVRKTI